MHASNPETIYSAGSGDWTQGRLTTVSGSARTVPMSHRDKPTKLSRTCCTATAEVLPRSASTEDITLAASVPADWVQAGEVPGIQGSTHLTTGLRSSTHLQPVFRFLNVSVIFITSSAPSSTYTRILHMTVALSASLFLLSGTNYLSTFSLLILYQFPS